MSTKTNRLMAAAAALVLVAGCSNEIGRTSSPVTLIVSNTQNIQRLDIAPGAVNCAQDVGTISVQALLKNPTVISDQRFNDVRITSYTVNYVRTDGGKLVPASFTRSKDALITIGSGATSLSKFLILEPGALTQAPFAALQTNNGGRDPETGRTFVQMDVVVTVFGETLAGEKVSGATRFPLDFCFQCNGCA
ncbi:MAG: hypothetical protein ABI837_02860 [Acidobacteriota bacterium]